MCFIYLRIVFGVDQIGDNQLVLPICVEITWINATVHAMTYFKTAEEDVLVRVRVVSAKIDSFMFQW